VEKDGKKNSSKVIETAAQHFAEIIAMLIDEIDVEKSRDNKTPSDSKLQNNNKFHEH
jgi:hypothetical protein